jgi:hypothetical protein
MDKENKIPLSDGPFLEIRVLCDNPGIILWRELQAKLPNVTEWSSGGGHYKGSSIFINKYQIQPQLPLNFIDNYPFLIYVSLEGEAFKLVTWESLYQQVEIARTLKKVLEELDCSTQVEFFFMLPNEVDPKDIL